MADQRAQYTEEAIGAGHPTKSDTVNRLALVEHNSDGTHGYNLTGYKELDLREFLPVGFVTTGSIDYSTDTGVHNRWQANIYTRRHMAL